MGVGMKSVAVAWLVFFSSQLAWAQTYLSPNEVGGDIPSGYRNLVFTLSDGNWSPQLRLPSTGQDRDYITVLENATYSTEVLQANSDVPVPSLTLVTGQSLKYQFSAARNRWEVVAPAVAVPNTGKILTFTTGNALVTRVKLSDGAWTPSVTFPASASDGAMVLVSSDATWLSKINPLNLLFPYTATLRKGDEYALVFHAGLAKWRMAKSPETLLTSVSSVGGAAGTKKFMIPVPTNAMTRLVVPSGTPSVQVGLPGRANDRDRVVIESASDVRSSITSSSQDLRTMSIAKGERYEFMWDAGKAQWLLLQAPDTVLKLGDLSPAGQVPAPKTPVTIVQAWDGNWASQAFLPKQAKPGDRIVMQSSAGNSFNVLAPGLVTQTVGKGEEVVFVLGANGLWQRETSTIRLLLTYGQGVVDRLGLVPTQMRQLESLRLTNAALANSGSKFRFQMAAMLGVPTLGKTLDDALSQMRSYAQIQTVRKQAAADAVYYEGVETGCGLAYVNAQPNLFNMAASGSLDCGTTVMRHELGHNMGLSHGNGVAPTVMSGNSLPYFATPNRYSSWLLPLGYGAAVTDEVRVMDNNAPKVANFRNLLP